MRATWTGFLQIALVSVPVKVYAATVSDEATSFHQLHGACSTRIQQRRWCPSCAKEVAFGELVKGAEVTRGAYVVLAPQDLDALDVPSTRVIDLTRFADARSLDPMHIDRTYYLAPDGPPVVASAFAVLAQALASAVGIGKLALYGREYLVAVRALILCDGRHALVLHTLHHAAELRAIDQIPALQGLPTIAAVDVQQVALARKLVAALSGPLDLATFTDAYREGLQQIIDAKIAGQAIVTSPRERPAPTIQVREALERSLAAVDRRKKTPAKAQPKKRTRAA